MLGNSIALATLAVMLASEAKRARAPWNFLLWTLSAALLIAAIALQPINDSAPEIGVFLTSIFSSPVAWFVLFMGLFLAVRPFWVKPPDTTADDEAAALKRLGDRALSISQFFQQYRNTKTIWRSDLPSIQPKVIDSVSLLMSLEKIGFVVPKLTGDNPYANAMALEAYFSVVGRMIRDGHVEEMRNSAQQVANDAEQAAARFTNERFWTARDW